jgi:uncharacterized protein
MTQKAPRRRFQVLSLSGGGYRGLFTARLVAKCEAHFNTKCSERFDLIAGTSIGALLAAGLSASVPAETLASAIADYGPKIFRKSLLSPARRLLSSAPYKNDRILEAIRKVLGRPIAERSLREYDFPLIIPSVNYTTGEAHIFRSKGVSGVHADDVSIEEAILASAAAPTFFPTRRIGTSEYIDGGLIANAPDLVALVDCMKLMNADLDRVYLASVGTAARAHGAAVEQGPRAPSSFSWIARRGLVQTIMNAQETLALSHARSLLGDRLLRLDKEPKQKQVAAINSLDKADESATGTLSMLADGAWNELREDRALRDFFLR